MVIIALAVVCIQMVTYLFIKLIERKRKKEMHWLKDEEEEEFTHQCDRCLSTGLSHASPRSP